MQRNIVRLFILVTSVCFMGCAMPKLFQVVVNQGNLVKPEMLEKLESGMTESQVKYIMGTPLISDTFAPNRWDYFTSVTQGETTYTNQKITLLFEENKLVSWEGKMETGS